MPKLPKIIVILGPTASGKTDLGIALAKQFNGEIISADSRQVYKKMRIGTDKPEGEWRQSSKAYFVAGVPHYLMDIIDPGKMFTVADFKKQAMADIKDIAGRGKLPIIVGGTGLYIWAMVDNLDIPKMAPKKKLRQGFAEKSLPELTALLNKIDPASARFIDCKNKRRVIRALEVSINTGESFYQQRTKSKPVVDALQIGISWPREILFERINQRCGRHMQDGLVAEVECLMKQKYSWQLPSMSGIGYRQIGSYLRGEITLERAVQIFKRDTRRYAKKQMTWFKRDKRIRWFAGAKLNDAKKLVKEFIT